MTNIFHRLLLLTAFASLAACSTQPQTLRPPPLQPAPVAPVSSSALPPAAPIVSAQPGVYAPPGPAAAAGGDLQAIPTLPSNTGVATDGNIAVGPDIDFGRNAVLGTWNVSSQFDTCALNLSLTTWKGGFRASTRRCTNNTLLGIGAWSLSGKQLILSNAEGDTLARLDASGPNRFDGVTDAGGKAISVFR